VNVARKPGRHEKEAVMSVAVSIVFTGLCALVTGENRPAQVLLVDARGVGDVSGIMLPDHAPVLVARMSTLANAEASSPTRIVAAWPGRSSELAGLPSKGYGVPEQVGLWDLAGSEVRIKVQGGGGRGVELYRAPVGKSSWPMAPRGADDLESWRDLRFIPDLQTLTGDGHIDPVLVDDTAGALPSRVSSRLRFESGRFEAGIPTQKSFREAVFEFTGEGGVPRLRQALSDTLRWSIEAEAPVVIEIIPTDGGEARRLVLTPAKTPHEIFVSNLPSENVASEAHHLVSEDEMAALHFGAYYALLRNPPADRPLPRRVPNGAHRKATGLIGSSLCPPGNFSY
jgi:hypothetical protein